MAPLSIGKGTQTERAVQTVFVVLLLIGTVRTMRYIRKRLNQYIKDAKASHGIDLDAALTNDRDVRPKRD